MNQSRIRSVGAATYVHTKSFMFTPEQAAWLERAARQRQTSQAAILRHAIELYRGQFPGLGTTPAIPDGQEPLFEVPDAE